MSLEQKVMTDLKAAMLARDEKSLRALRAIKSAIIIAKTAEGSNGEIKEEDEVKMLQKLVKQRRDSLEIYEKQNREDLAEKEREEIAVIEKFLPKQLDEKELMRQHDLHVVTTDKETEIFQLKNLVKELRQTLEAQQMQTEKKLNEVENKLASDIRSYKKIIQELREKLENNLHESK